ncbi:hypothetical protein EZV62_004063 [Acer yangbiense]|uniref:Uncharacterized protein n=1 Tax=Acer yangbiense TaxID=1000413 RepID=A0A5C7IJ12_9ROSI|nr:hypothetical protein EZV62_004063 [Acer yangbiense]
MAYQGRGEERGINLCIDLRSIDSVELGSTSGSEKLTDLRINQKSTVGRNQMRLGKNKRVKWLDFFLAVLWMFSCVVECVSWLWALGVLLLFGFVLLPYQGAVCVLLLSLVFVVGVVFAMAEIPYIYRPSNWFHARILIHQRFTGLNRMRDSLDKVGELKRLQDGVFRQFLESPRLRIFGVRGCVSRCFDGKVPTFHTILNQLDEGNFDKSDDAIKLSYLFLLGHVLLGIEYGKTVPRRFMTGRNKQNQNFSKKQNLGVNIYGFAWAFQVWAMEAIPCLTGVHGLRISNVYPRLMNWCCKNKPKKLDNEFTDEMESIPTLTPTADELQQDYMVFFNPENAMGDVPETSEDDVMVSESDKELLSESVTWEMKSNANQDRGKKKTYTVDPQETVASDIREKLFAHVIDQIRAAEKWMTKSFTRQFDILREEVRSQRNAPYT